MCAMELWVGVARCTLTRHHSVTGGRGGRGGRMDPSGSTPLEEGGKNGSLVKIHAEVWE